MSSIIQYKNSASQLKRWEFFLVLFFILYYVLPMVQNLVPFGILTIVGTIYALFIARGEKFFTRALYKLVLFSLYISIIYLLLTETNTIGSDVSGRVLKRVFSKYDQVFSLFFPAFIGCHVTFRASIRQKKIMLLTFFTCFMIVIVQTLKAMQIYPNITRTFEMRTDEEIEMYASLRSIGLSNIGNFYFVYSVPFIIVVSLAYIIHVKASKEKFVAAGIFLGLSYFIITSQFSLAFLITIIGLALMLYATSCSTSTRILSIALLFIFFVLFPTLLNVFISHSSSELMKTRLSEILNFLESGDKSGDNLFGRLDLYWKSFLAFLESPIWGNRHLNFDGHSTFLTYLSDIGLLGSIPLFYLFRMTYKNILRYIRVKKEEFRVLYIMIILMGLTNPIVNSYSIPLCLWFVSPIILNFIYERSTRFQD